MFERFKKRSEVGFNNLKIAIEHIIAPKKIKSWKDSLVVVSVKNHDGSEVGHLDLEAVNDAIDDLSALNKAECCSFLISSYDLNFQKLNRKKKLAIMKLMVESDNTLLKDLL